MYPEISFHEFYNSLPNFVLFIFLGEKLPFFTHDIYPHPHPRPTATTHDLYPLPTTHDPRHLATLYLKLPIIVSLSCAREARTGTKRIPMGGTFKRKKKVHCSPVNISVNGGSYHNHLISELIHSDGCESYLNVNDLRKIWKEEFLPSIKCELKSELEALRTSIKTLTARVDGIEKSQSFISEKYESVLKDIPKGHTCIPLSSHWSGSGVTTCRTRS